ncbi:MAG: oligosaccharide flippase family protein [Ferruginibacter sp.]
MKNNSNISALPGNAKVVKSSFWGIAANGLQSILLSLAFLIQAREYSKAEFAPFLIATNIYQLLAAFSTLGLGQWFTRELIKAEDSKSLVHKFLKMQMYSGIFFYALNIVLAWLLYRDYLILQVAVLLGINVVFDNFIYGIRSLNIAEFRQQKTFTVLLIDSLLKFLASCILLIYHIDIVTLSLVLILARFLTLNVFITYGTSGTLNVIRLLAHKVKLGEIRQIITENWVFIIIGSVSIVYWRIGNLVISKMLTAEDVANYEASYRVFSLALILPMIVSTTVFPQLVTLHKEGNREKLVNYFHRVFQVFLLYSLMGFTFVYSFAQYLIPFIFGQEYANNVDSTIQMFLAVLVFPTVLLQANMLVALHKEKADMWLNVVALLVNATFSVGGILLFKSMIGVNLAIFLSFLVFHILQDWLLFRMKISSLRQVLQFYVLTLVIGGAYIFAARYIPPVWLYIVFWSLAGFIIIKTVIGFDALKGMLKK